MIFYRLPQLLAPARVFGREARGRTRHFSHRSKNRGERRWAPHPEDKFKPMKKNVPLSLPMIQHPPRQAAQPVSMTQAEIRRLVIETIG